jgi:thiamine-phosphate pyrophosphorylase
MIDEPYTPGAERALERASERARRRGAALVDPGDLLAALAADAEGHAAAILLRHGVQPDELLAALGCEGVAPEGEPGPAADRVPLSQIVRAVLAEATLHARQLDRSRPVGTEHLLAALVTVPGPWADLLSRLGLPAAELASEFESVRQTESAPLPLDPEIAPLELAGPAEAVDLARILDASANRAREGLRVVEDYVRFALDDPMLTRRIKEVRHRLGEATRGLPVDELLASRDTTGDVGTHITTTTERTRENPRAVLSASFKRAAEALRTLEEYTKLADTWLSGRFEVLRYDVYTLEKLTLTALHAHETIGEARLYVLVGGLPTLGDLRWVVEEALAGGAQVIQLREKGLPDREVLRRAREVRLATRAAGARFILNDRPDLARLAGADGLHLGQEDLPVRDARRIAGPRAIIGISTHDRAQLERAVLEGAGYLGVGPVFPSPTKQFTDLAGLAFVRQAAESVTLPWFALGGIDLDNVESVLDAGAERIAVSSAVVRAPSPRQAAAELRARLDERG